MSKNDRLLVGSETDIQNLAVSIRTGFQDGAEMVELLAIGPRAVNQAVKAVAVARRRHKMPVVITPLFFDVDKPTGPVTGLKLEVRMA